MVADLGVDGGAAPAVTRCHVALAREGLVLRVGQTDSMDRQTMCAALQHAFQFNNHCQWLNIIRVFSACFSVLFSGGDAFGT